MIDRRTLIVSGTAAAAVAATPAQAITPVGPQDMVQGSAAAPVTVIEYASASCPHCARWALEVYPEFHRRFIATGQVRFVLREFLTSPAEMAAAGFLLARCGGRSQYFEILHSVFEVQEEIFRSNDVRGPLQRVAREHGISPARFNACVGDSAGLRALSQRFMRWAQVDRIDSTPTFIVNGRRLEGEQTIDDLAAAIARARRGRR